METLAVIYGFWLIGFICTQAGIVISLYRDTPLTENKLVQIGWLSIVLDSIILGIADFKLLWLTAFVIIVALVLQTTTYILHNSISWSYIYENNRTPNPETGRYSNREQQQNS